MDIIGLIATVDRRAAQGALIGRRPALAAACPL